MITKQEVEQYIRLTLKQWKLEEVSVLWKADTKGFLGLARVARKEIVLNEIVLKDFKLFEEVLKHEIAHFRQYEKNGFRFLRKNGRWQLHGADFKAACREVGFPARSCIPVPSNYFA